jgi:hypothetical protein
LKEEALDRINWRNRFGRGCGPVVWQITDDDDDDDLFYSSAETLNLFSHTARILYADDRWFCSASFLAVYSEAWHSVTSESMNSPS